MKWFLLILPMIIKRFTSRSNPNPIDQIKTFISENAFKILLAFTAASTIGSLFVAGIILMVLNLTAQYDSGQKPILTSMAASGLGLALIAMVIFISGIYFATAHDRKIKKEEKEKHKEGHSLEEILILLANDFMKERELKTSQSSSSEVQGEKEYTYDKSEENTKNYHENFQKH